MPVQPWILATLLTLSAAAAAGSAPVDPLLIETSSSPIEARVVHRADEPVCSPAPKLAPRETFLDVACDLFLPGKADPYEFMATATLARLTYDGFNYQYGYDPMAQSYDVVVSGLATQGIIVQETVGVLAAPIPASLEVGQIVRVEVWFLVEEHNLFPDEGVGITALESGLEPSSGLDAVDMRRLYDDARGFTGGLYVLEHFAPGAHAIDLGAAAVTDFSEAIANQGWFGVGFAADGWDLSGSDGQSVYWQLAGGGGLPAGSHPFFRVYYNAPPAPFSQLHPASGASLSDAQPRFEWRDAADPNGDEPITYTLRLGNSPELQSAVEIDAGSHASADAPFPLALGTYHWEVIASDPMGATRSSGVSSFQVVLGTDAPARATEKLRLTAAPNPFNPRTTLRFELIEDGPVRLEIFDTRGQRIRSLDAGYRPAGSHSLVWDGSDDAGRSCSSGSYLVRLHTGSGSRTLRIALVR